MPKIVMHYLFRYEGTGVIAKHYQGYNVANLTFLGELAWPSVKDFDDYRRAMYRSHNLTSTFRDETEVPQSAPPPDPPKKADPILPTPNPDAPENPPAISGAASSLSVGKTAKAGPQNPTKAAAVGINKPATSAKPAK